MKAKEHFHMTVIFIIQLKIGKKTQDKGRRGKKVKEKKNGYVFFEHLRLYASCMVP
jgi:hypothetical protein